MRLVSIDMLTPDMKLAFPVYFKEALVLNAGRDNIARYIQNMKNMGIRFVYVEDDASEGIEIPDVITSKSRNDCKQALKNVMSNYIATSSVKLTELSLVLDTVISDILKNRNVQLSLNDIGTVDEYTYLHSVNVAVYSLLMGEKLGYDKKNLDKLAIGAMLHDLGKTVLDPEIQFKQGPLTDEEYEVMKKHAEYSYEILSGESTLPEESKKIALMHHERLDGTGYPMGLKGDEISEFAQIVAIADVYDALISDRCYRLKWPASRAVDYLIEKSGTYFSPELVQLFIQRIAIYPNGSMVELSDGTKGIVRGQNRNVPMRPIIRVIYDKDGKEIKPYEINLMETLSITIIKSELEINWAEGEA